MSHSCSEQGDAPICLALSLRGRSFPRYSRVCAIAPRYKIVMLRAEWPEAADKQIYTLKEFAGLTGDIDDPAGQDEDVFARCRDEIKACLLRSIERL